MNIYEGLTDPELVTKITELRTKYETAITGGVAVVVAGEGRRLEYTRSNASGLMSLLSEAIREQQRRAGVVITGAIPVTFPYGGDFYG